jgi:hypothetical protein
VVELEEAKRALQDGREGALDWVQAIEQRSGLLIHHVHVHLLMASIIFNLLDRASI